MTMQKKQKFKRKWEQKQNHTKSAPSQSAEKTKPIPFINDKGWLCLDCFWKGGEVDIDSDKNRLTHGECPQCNTLSWGLTLNARAYDRAAAYADR